jgi:hypothetical protein
MLEQFRTRLVIPYLTTLRLFDPVRGNGSPAVRRVLADVTERVTPRAMPAGVMFGRDGDPNDIPGVRAVAEEHAP